jgi:peptidyl-prolyl cis-trans isomerase D
MMKFLRSQSQTVLIVILAFIGVGFFFYGSSGFLSGSGGGGPTDFGRIDGEDLQQSDIYNAVRNERTTLMLFNRSEEQPTSAQIAQEAWTRLLLLHEAAKLHIDVSDADLVARIQSQPEFQKDGVYSPDQFRAFTGMLAKLHQISADNYGALMQDQMRMEAVFHTLFSSIHAAGGDANASYNKEYGPVQVSYVTFSGAPYVTAVKVTPAEIEAAYKADPMDPAYRTDEKRQVEYVLFPLTPEQLKLPDKDKNAAIQALGEKALDFALALQPDPNAPSGSTPPAADFQAEAKKRGLTPIATNDFAAGTPPSGMAPSPAFNNAAFALTKEDAVSKVVQLDNGVVVMHLVQIQPSEIKPLAEVTPVIQKQLQQQKGVRAQQAAAASAAAALKAAVKKNGDFMAAAAAQHLVVQKLPSFTPDKIGENDMRLGEIAYFSKLLAPGEVSSPIPIQSDNTVIILHLDSRGTADPAGLAAFEKNFHDEQDGHLRSAALGDWVQWKSRQPGTHQPPRLDAYGAVGE